MLENPAGTGRPALKDTIPKGAGRRPPTRRNARAWIGASGWNYPSWRGVLYPRGLPQRKWLPQYAREFDTVEVNNSFYRIPPAESVEDWASETPLRFRFALKLWRGITHFKKLRGTDDYLDHFLEAAGHLERGRRAPLLVQLPPQQGKDIAKLSAFLDSLKQRIRYQWKAAVEFRHNDWLCPELYRLLDRHRVAICLHDMPDRAAAAEPNDASFVYVRRHGPHGGYSGGYSARQIDADARRVRDWISQGRTVFFYYNNDSQGFAVRNARALLQAVAQV